MKKYPYFLSFKNIDVCERNIYDENNVGGER